MSGKPSRVSVVPPPPPPEKGAFKIEKRDDGVMIATPTKAGKLAPSPSHACERHAKQWLPLDVMDPEGASVVSKLSAASDSQRHPSLTTGPFPPRHKSPSPIKSVTSSHAKIPPVPNAARPTPPPATTTKASPLLQSDQGKEMKQLLQLLLKNNLAKTESDTSNDDFDKTRYDAKRGRDLYDKASEGLPANERHELKRNTAIQCSRLLRRKFDDYSWGSALNQISTKDGPKSLLWNYREITLEDVMKEAEACWGPNNAVVPTTDPKITQERMIRQMIGNWIRNSLKSSSYDQLELKRKSHGCFRASDSKHMHDGPTMMKLELDVINPEARANMRDLKDKLRKTSLADFEGDVVKMLTHMELLCECIISENETHDDLIIDILESLHTAQDATFLGTVEKIQDECDAGTKLSVQDIINRATTKHNKLLNRNQRQHKGNKKYLSFNTSSQPEDDSTDKQTNIKNDPKAYLKVLPQWRKQKIPGEEVIEKDGKTFYFCPHHKNAELGYPDGLCVCSHRPDQHEEHVACRRANKPFHINKSPLQTNHLHLANSLWQKIFAKCLLPHNLTYPNQKLMN